MTEGPTPEMERIYESGRGKLPEDNQNDLLIYGVDYSSGRSFTAVNGIPVVVLKSCSRTIPLSLIDMRKLHYGGE